MVNGFSGWFGWANGMEIGMGILNYSYHVDAYGEFGFIAGAILAGLAAYALAKTAIAIYEEVNTNSIEREIKNNNDRIAFERLLNDPSQENIQRKKECFSEAFEEAKNSARNYIENTPGSSFTGPASGPGSGIRGGGQSAASGHPGGRGPLGDRNDFSWVKGHYRKGKWVPGHWRKKPGSNAPSASPFNKRLKPGPDPLAETLIDPSKSANDLSPEELEKGLGLVEETLAPLLEEDEEECCEKKK